MLLRAVLILLCVSSPAWSQAITAFCAGGVTGGGGGMRAERDGRIVQLRRDRLKPSIETELGRDAAAVAAWNAALDRAAFDTLRLHAPGNITCSLRRGSRAIAWSLEPPASLAAEIRTVFRELRSWRPPSRSGDKTGSTPRP
ncbi:hypothetical protein [Plastoroseomonas arctica]|uniref:Uncharacterized protein n=1 Tax=Plastoroseomonas arctica TaxID=1509237 RepID=A0AAF1K4K7_9PROT|nr:hypothetical protein [Plastoroseomonas arctica]MBR0656136.1 hypothetical protein [Plastoroseomonas arctica]